MKSGFMINSKILGMTLTAAALSFFLSAEPASAAGCREMAVSIGGCVGPDAETCILDYCAGKAFDDFMNKIRDENRRKLKQDNKDETRENVSEDTIGACQVGEGPACTEMVFKICPDTYDATVTFTLGGFLFYSGTISMPTIPVENGCTPVLASVFVQKGSTHKLVIACEGDGMGGAEEACDEIVPSCEGVYEVVSGGECVGGFFDLDAGQSKMDQCTAN